MRRIFGLAVALLLLLPLADRAEGQRAKVGSTTVENMEIVLYIWGPRELVGPGAHASPEAGQQVTHHLDVTVYDQLRRIYIPYLSVRATIIDMITQREVPVDLEPMLGEWLHYGANISLAHRGRYSIVVTIQPPDIVRYKHLTGVWSTPARVAFDFTYQ